MNNAYLRIGQIVRPQGVRGDVRLNPETDDTARFRGLKEAFLEEHGGYRAVTLSGMKMAPDAIILHIAGVEDRNAAELLRGCFLCVDRAHAVNLAEHTWFMTDLIGCETSDTDGRTYGPVTDVLKTGANDVYEIASGRLMVPALIRVLHEVDIPGKRIVFDADVLKEVGLFED